MKIAVLLPELLGTYGDGGNARVLVHRAAARGVVATIEHVHVDDAIPSADLYMLGGGEDGPQRLASERLTSSSLVSRIHDGAHVFAVCAGLQLLGHSFCVEGDDAFPGLGLVNSVTTRGTRRSVGELATAVDDHVLVGFENHGGRTTLGNDVRPLGRVLRGEGNDGHVDGFRAERLWATYAHGPVLALNPWLADEVLSSVIGEPLAPFRSVADDLHWERRRALGV